MNFPHQKVKAHQPPPDPTEQSTDRNGGGMSGKLKKKIIKIRRNRNRTKKADRQKQVESAERTMSMLELADENDVYVDTPHDRMDLNFPPPLPPPSAPNQSSIHAKQLKNISDQFHQLPSLNSSEKVAKRAAPLKQNCKKPLTNEDIRAINLWCELALKSIPMSPSFSFLQIAFQSGPYSGGTPFNVNRLVNKFPESPYLKTLREVSLKVLRDFSGGSERQSFKVLEVIRKIERNKAKHTQGKTDASVTAFGVTDWNDPKNAAKLEKEYTSVTSVDQRNWIHSKIPEGARVLDYGCGPGYLLEILSSDSVGVDTSVAMCEMSRKRNAGKQIVHLQLQDGRDVCRELEAGSFDFVVVCQVLLYCEEPLETIRRLHGLLKPEGRLILVETDWDSLIVDIEDRELYDTVKWNCLRTFLHMGRKLVGLMALNFDVVDVDSFNMNSTGANEDEFMYNWAFQIVPTKLRKFEIDEKVIEDWLEIMERNKKSRKFYCSLDRSMVVGQKVGGDWEEEPSDADSDDDS